jgi:hypothetical protein
VIDGMMRKEEKTNRGGGRKVFIPSVDDTTDSIKEGR